MPKPMKTPSAIDATRMTREIRRIVCSAQWFDACWAAVQTRTIRARQQMAVALDAARLYPPGGVPKASRPHPTRMRQCTTCGAVWYPPQYVHGSPSLCDDCAAAQDAPYTDERTHTSSTSSPSAAAIHALQFRRERLVELPLEADDEASLRREIAEHHAKANDPQRSSTPSKLTKKHVS